ncbi:hypothetical protein GXM_09320 [Nostoc sphaeroides CCNUC1]|uniref:Uncharacterized protein n=1 Tax=Nostoc sphaeroides CCNUC1 TaxID=2653204 RepID=A0A5P8WI53_9NOSO|nr:hypothetical protein GXM_09320 [Nostoc sphaeroides CCNUC1]
MPRDYFIKNVKNTFLLSNAAVFKIDKLTVKIRLFHSPGKFS